MKLIVSGAGPYTVLAAATVASLACARGVTSVTSEPLPSATQDVDASTRVVAQDSVRIVELAIKAIVAQNEPRPLVVSRFVRDKEGTIVGLIGKPDEIEGGGGLVWVHASGYTVVLRRYQ